jgi:hypothetical protein
MTKRTAAPSSDTPTTSSTPYKDELIRIRALLGLEEDADVSAAVEDLRTRYMEEVTDHAKSAGLKDATDRAMAEVSTARQTAQTKLDDAVGVVRQVQADLYARRARAGSQQGYADMTAAADKLGRVL